MNRIFRSLAGLIGAAAGGYAAYAALTYSRYGRITRPPRTASLLDTLMPEYEVIEVHQCTVEAPADVAFAAARGVSFSDSPLVRAIFALRSVPALLSGASVRALARRSILEETRSLRWRRIGGEAGRQIIMGAVTQPWKQNVEFHGLAADEFIAFHEPGFAKIAWTIEARPLSSMLSEVRTETRVVTTDAISREKFRRYWSFLSPGIIVIRYETLRLVKAKAESEFRGTGGGKDVPILPD